MEMSNRAYSLLDVKSVNEDQRVIEGIASTPTADRLGDIMEPMGAKFALPMPLLWQHDSKSPVGHVHFAKPTKDGIPFKAKIATVAEPGKLKDRLDEAWQSVKAGLVRAVSIGFKGLAAEDMRSGGVHYTAWEWLELSLVTIPANAEASIQNIKEYDTRQRAATGQEKLQRVVRLDPPGVTGKSQPKTPPKEGTTTMNIAENISGLEAKLVATKDRMPAALAKSIEEGRTPEAHEQEEFDNAEREVEAIEKQLENFRRLEKHQARTAKPVAAVHTEADASAVRGGVNVSVKAQPKLDPGIGYARLVKVKMAAKLTGDPVQLTAQRMYGADSEVYGIVTKANEVVAGTTISGNWAYDLVSQEGAAVAAFLEYLRPATILGRFGVGGIPALNKIDFYSPYVTETGAGAAYWVGEGKPKPLTSFDYDRSTLTPLKIANIAVLTEENIRYSSPNSDVLVRNALGKAIAAGLDTAFIDPANAGSANVKPAAVTYQAETIVSEGDTADDIRLDVRSLFQKFIDANNPPMSGVFIMSATNALALSMMLNPLGQREFADISMNGGSFMGLPVIVSQYISNVVALVNASDIFLGDEGGVAVDMSREASIEMRSSGLGMDATAGTATVGSVSMFQTNSVALRAERTISWKRARTSAVAYLTAVGWGGEVNTV